MIQETIGFVKNELEGADSGHDWWHVLRVYNLARHIAEEEGADRFIVEMAALLHDVGDPKLHDGDETVAPRLIGGWLDELGLEKDKKDHIMHIIENMSFSKHLDGKKVEKSTEFKVVQDADRIDGIGAIGIARTFAYGGHKGREIYNPDKQFKEGLTKEEYRKANDPTINHFYEKLLKLKELMNTKTGKKIAEGRHEFMELFLKQFYDEWEGRA